MTTVIAMMSNDSVYMAADSAVTDETIVMEAKNSKISRHANFLMAYIGSVSMGTLLASRTYEEIPSENTIGYLFDKFIPFCKKQIKKAGCDPKEYAMTQLLLGHETGIYEIVLDPPIIVKHAETAAGSGANFALGSLHTSFGRAAEYRIIDAMAAAEKYDPFTQGPTNLEIL